MLKSIFNKAVQYAEDAAYGFVLPGMNESTRLKTTLYGGLGAAVGTAGALMGDGAAMAIGTAVVTSAAFAFQQRGMAIRHALEAQPR
jgi:hypothetical protein